MSFIFVVALVVVGWLLYKQYFQALLNQGRAGQIKLILIALGLFFLLMAVTGRAHAIFAIIGAALTQVMRFAPLLMRFLPMFKSHLGPSSAGPGHSGSSQVKTPSLVMTLDHASGSLDGEILAGELKGRQLTSLSLQELTHFYQYCKETDSEATRLLMSYIMRERQEEWREAHPGEQSEQYTGAGNNSRIDLDEARQILGLEGNVTREDITQAHRSLMGKFHPDKGGNTYLATKLNNARDVLLASLDK
ncbi:MAG: hypothetical protein KTR32_13075 [Granulosicoccus sp.]|nr:hypothetical protein [Granulosicoccus sp.]